ncbi:SulP family inorganic anion transporter [Sediminicoccus sp. KRV36]|uniref:SulP family inorganic anion transporter n=1 Tax=Sediminicoccus sp. KRV36 TaxID=3133721 RepID=UPI00200F6128|nr:SulP family inorganic anion transporter [Sediminicoccus rosea]UPY38854.1 cyclic nucleotide-binding domain-containing protein [Sediminicoccus rosea]
MSADGGSLGRDLRAGGNAGILAAAQTLTHGMIAFAPLGPQGVAFGMAAALAASAAAGLAVALLGSSRPLVGTTTAATALVTAGCLTAIGSVPLGQGIMLAMLLALLAGGLMLALGLSGFAGLAALTPSPVTLGIGNAIVLLILLGQAPLLLGMAPGQGLALEGAAPAALLVAGVAVLLMLKPLPLLPPPLVALAVAGLLHHALAAAALPVGPLVGVAPSMPELADGLRQAWREGLPAAPWMLVVTAALSMAVLGALEVLVAGSALREASGRRANPGQDLAASGFGMLAGGASGGAPAAALGSISLACWRWGGRGRAAMLARAGVTLLALLLAGQAIALLPYAALSGALVGAVLRLFQARPLWPFAGVGWARRAADAGVILVVMGTALVFGLVAAVGAGVLLSVLLFTVSMSRSAIRRCTRNPVGRSRVRRAPEVQRRLRELGASVALVELEGAIFFGSAENIIATTEALRRDGAAILVLDLSRVTRMDFSGGRRLLEACRAAPGQTLLAPLHAGGRAREELAALGLLEALPPASIFPDLASAMEAAEEMLLAAQREAAPPAPQGALEALAALGLPGPVPALLLPRMEECHFPAGAPILRQGEPADAAFLLREGEVIISLPGTEGRPATRLAVLSAGVIFGESALLGARLRSADVMARTEVRCLRLGVAQAEALRIAAPEAAWALMAAVARQLSAHVAAANGIIDQLES